MRVLEFTIPVSQDRSLIVQEDIAPNFYIHFHRHLELQITWIIDGEGTLIAGSNMQRFCSNDVFIIGCNQPHVFKSDPEYFDEKLKRLVHSITIFFNPAALMTSLFEMPEMKGAREFIKNTSYGMQASSTSKKVLADYIGKVKRNKAGFRLASFIELLQLMSNLKDWKLLSTESLQPAISDHEGLRMNDIYQYTMANYTKDISIDKIASIAYLTPPAFCRYFKKHTCKTYSNFLNEVRINEACKKIINEDYESVASIAYQTGFNNVVTFNRVFRKLKGRTPRDYIRDYTQNIESGYNLQ